MNEKAVDFSLDFFSLKGKTAIVTGANTGLGQAYAVALAKVGANVFAVSREIDWTDTKALIDHDGGNATYYEADLSDRSSIQGIVDTCVETYGSVDILVNNAGLIKRNPLLEFKVEDWDSVMAVNLDAVYLLSQACAKVMVEQGSGKIINIASMLSFQGGKFIPPYTASKHAVAGLTKSFANELAHHGIQVNAIAPGYIATNNTAPIRADEKRNAEILARIPAGYWADPSDLMGTVVFLSSRASDYMNGHVLAVDGGWLAR
ncbi:2-dehydro-3-deoxy-D-gluconate 5-dehydrogenase KduD [Saliterribacillus persicus]|uniref:2-deoxy-D-gluconate 3-dehydrogenase n=1 Tax=Saliterribacillus persicus TaxID=930114 RepID=A0A368YBC8_9BACI|nr:2-dehydro-3-deoxy-D-gluconate 5-dehydrogenase KduD [Saliterribacillus persicus]RCW76728.1 2-deoxy-D-gluconate 3-dehydrogenase [Saliterribacillus persicus]